VSRSKQQDDAANGQKKRRWLWPLLIISLGLNLLFVGLVAGRIWTHGYGGRPAMHNRILTGAVEILMKDLPQVKRQHASALLMRHRATMRPLRQQIREAHRAAKAAVLADPYDEEKVDQTLGRLREIKAGMHQSVHMMMMGLMKDLTLKQRQELVNHIRAGFKHRRGRWRRSGDMPGGEPRPRSPQ